MKKTIRFLLLPILIFPASVWALFTTPLSIILYIKETFKFLCDEDTDFDTPLKILMSPALWMHEYVTIGKI